MTPPGVAGGVGDPRAIAHQILGEDRFRPAPLPRPLHGVLDALGGALAPIGDALSDAFSAVAGLVPGGTATAWVLLGGLVVGLAGLAAARLTDRTLVDRTSSGTRAGRGEGGPPDARALEAAAEAAERDGRLEAAVRLRFQAGLLRLDELGVLAYRPSLATAAVARRLGSPVFDGLARRFEELAYGGRRADPGDAGRAREGWERVLADAGRRG
ncbi:MAG: hypothetical protein QOE44_2607 [Solirubrobacteraceae bacterium]|nr:hypothetical protein [Solirubrobacteraceae bacterium]